MICRDQCLTAAGSAGILPAGRGHPWPQRNKIRISEGVHMDWRVLLTTFGIIFLAEMGDKTQLAAMTMAADKKRPWEVFLGASLALAAVSAVGILVGTALGHYLPLDWIKRVAGAAFVVIGVLILIGKF